MSSEGLRFNSPHYQSMGFWGVSWIGSGIVWSNTKTPLLERERDYVSQSKTNKIYNEKSNLTIHIISHYHFLSTV